MISSSPFSSQQGQDQAPKQHAQFRNSAPLIRGFGSPTTWPLLVCAAVLAGFQLTASAQAPSSELTDPRGPVAGWEGKTLVNAQGVQAVHFNFVPPAGSQWQPQWIWAGTTKNSGKVPLAAHFRKLLTLPAAAQIAGAYAKVSADRAYRLWVNGRLVSRGPADPGSDEWLFTHWSHQWLYNQVDLAPYLHAGQNVIAAEVFTSNMFPNFSMGRPGFALEAKVSLVNGTSASLSTGEDWKAEPIEAYSEGPLATLAPVPPDKSSPAGLLYDARLDDPEWRSASYPDKDWAFAEKIDSVWGPLAVSQIPEAMEAVWPVESIGPATPNVTTDAPLSQIGRSIRVAGNGSFAVNFGRVLSGYLSMKVSGAAGTVITLEPVETRDDHAKRPAQVTLRAGETLFEYPLLNSFTTVRVTVSNATQAVEFADIRATFASQPVAYRGSFTSSDPHLNSLWTTSRWLTQLCMQGHYLDSPDHQEPIGDFGDYLIEALENDYAFNEPWLARQDLRKFAGILDNYGSATFHTSYALLWLQMLVDYYDYTGDQALLRELKPTADRLLDRFATFQGANGLLSEAPNYMFMDWVAIAGFQTHHPPAVIGQGYMTAFYYRALADGARLAKITGDADREARYEKLRPPIHDAVERELWDQKAGLYRDGKPFQNHQKDPDWLPEDKDIVTHSVQMNSLAVLYDLAPKSRRKAIMDKLFSTEPINAQPYFMHFIFAAEDHAGVFNRYAWAQMQRWHINPETRTFNEMWAGGDWSHAWGGTPLIQLSARVLGVTPAMPGYGKIAIQPHPAGLKFAKGVVPTAKGDVSVAWTLSDSEFTLDFTIPEIASADIILPETDLVNPLLIVDGKMADAPYQKGMTLTLTGGTHRLIVQSQ
jgi:hypothetical protein